MSKVRAKLPHDSIRGKYAHVSSVWLTVGVFFGSQILGSLVFGLLILALPAYRGLSGAEIQDLFAYNPWLYLTLLLCILGVFFVLLQYAMRYMKLGARDIGIGRFKSNYVAYAFAGYVAVLAMNVVLFALLRATFSEVDFDQEQVLAVGKDVAGSGLIPVFVSLVIIPPIMEELLMRGFLFTGLRRRLSFLPSAIVVSVLFGLAHMSQAENGVFISGVIGFSVLSLMLCWLRERTGSLWPSIGVHMLQNGFAFYFIYIAKDIV